MSGRPARRRRRQGRDPRDHREDRRRRRRAATPSSTRDRAFAGHVHGRAHDRLQHVDRGGRAGRHGRARRDDLRVPRGPALRAAGRPLGPGARALADAALGSGRRLRPRGDPRRRRRSRPPSPGARARRRRCPSPSASPIPPRASDPARRQAVERMLAVHGPRARARRSTHVRSRPRVHRLVHQQPPRGPARRRRGGPRAAARWCRRCVVPGSGLVKRAAEAEGLDRVFTDAGFEWRDPGCSMCVGMNGDLGRARRAHRLHLQPQLRGPPGQGRPHPPDEPGHGRRRRGHRAR